MDSAHWETSVQQMAVHAWISRNITEDILSGLEWIQVLQGFMYPMTSIRVMAWIVVINCICQTAFRCISKSQCLTVNHFLFFLKCHFLEMFHNLKIKIISFFHHIASLLSLWTSMIQLFPKEISILAAYPSFDVQILPLQDDSWLLWQWWQVTM